MAEHDDVGRSESTQTESSPWKPVSQPPEYGVLVLIYGPGRSHAMGNMVWHEPSYYIARFYDHDDWRTYVAYITVEPTHWMPLPEPPTDT